MSDGEAQQHVAKEGDIVIIQERYDCMSFVLLKKDACLNNRYGRFAHNDVLGKPLGRRWDALSHPGANAGSQQCAGFVHVLAPTPELWSMAILHRTQIVYPHDSAIIAMYLDLRPGSIVIESGTGSGSASTAFARVVAPHGRVLSFEFHRPRAEAAAEDFRTLGIADVVTVRGGVDVVEKGFVGVPDGHADAVFLDLPAPYKMGAELARVLRPDGAVCTFSPCLEQVQRTCAMLREGPFHSVRTITAPVRTYETRERGLDTPGFDDLFGADGKLLPAKAPSGGAAPSTFNQAQQGRTVVKRRRSDGCNGNASATNAVTAVLPAGAGGNVNGVCDGDVAPEPDGPPVTKRARRQPKTAAAERSAIAAAAGEGAHDGRVLRPSAILRSKPFSSMKGHTSYLTFARRMHDDGEVQASASKSRAAKVGAEVAHARLSAENCVLS